MSLEQFKAYVLAMQSDIKFVREWCAALDKRLRKLEQREEHRTELERGDDN